MRGSYEETHFSKKPYSITGAGFRSDLDAGLCHDDEWMRIFA